MSIPYSLQQLADFLGAELAGAPGCASVLVNSLAPLQTAEAGQLTFLSKPAFAKYLDDSKAAAVIVGSAVQTTAAVPLLRVKNPYLAYAQVSALFDNRPICAAGIHRSAVVEPSANVAASASIGANVVIEADVVIGEHTEIEAGTVVGARTVIGNNCHIHRNVTLCHSVSLGDRVTIHSGAVIGADGFGFAQKPGGWQKIHQLGSVRIGSDVDIGANTTVDRGALGDTVIEDGVIIDNLVQVAHNVHIGKNTAIAGCAGIAGSTRIGANCTIAGSVGLAGHLVIADNVHITGMSLVMNSISEAGSYSSGTGGVSPSGEWRRNAVRFNQLDGLAKRLIALEKKELEKK